jgi:[ribosomal protein S18]-alanine N-acetyltransferase
MDYYVYTPQQPAEGEQLEHITDFLFKHLDEYGDQHEDILKALEYALSTNPAQGGFILQAEKKGQTVGAVVINDTGMEGYIPEHILVYIAVHNGKRGEGIGRKLMQKAIDLTEGSIALHVEPDNPARILYEKLGFTNKYLEMRLHKP